MLAEQTRPEVQVKNRKNNRSRQPAPGREPTLKELLGDPIVKAAMRADNVNADAFEDMFRTVIARRAHAAR